MTSTGVPFLDIIGIGEDAQHPRPGHDNLRVSLTRDMSAAWQLTEIDAAIGDGVGHEGCLVPGAVRSALAETDGQYVALVRSSDMVESGTVSAIRAVVEEMKLAGTTGPAALPAVIYTDEIWPSPDYSGEHAKPHFSLRALRQYDLFGQLTLIRRDVLQDVLAHASLTAGAEAAWTWELHLRLAEWALERRQSIIHVPVFGLTRTTPRDVSADYMRAAVSVVQAHLDRSGAGARAEASNDIPGDIPGLVRVTPQRPEDQAPQRVSIVIPTGGGRRTFAGVEEVLVQRAISSIMRLTDYPHYEIVVVTSEGTDPALAQALHATASAAGKGADLAVVEAPGRFNFSGSCNTGVAASRGDVVLLLNDDTEVTDPAWLRTMLAITADDTAGRVGAVGPKLLFPDGMVQHGGVHSDVTGNVGHTLFYQPDAPGAQGEAAVDMDVMGVTGACLLVSRAAFEEVGGLSTVLPLNYNDVDLCFKLRARGYTNVYTPRTSLIHYESATRKVSFTNAERSLLAWWLPWSMNDPNIQLFGVR